MVLFCWSFISLEFSAPVYWGLIFVEEVIYAPLETSQCF